MQAAAKFCPARAPKQSRYQCDDDWLTDDDSVESLASSDCSSGSDDDEIEYAAELERARAAARRLDAPQAMRIYRDELFRAALGVDVEHLCAINVDLRILYRNPTINHMHTQLAHSAARLVHSNVWSERDLRTLRELPFAALFELDPLDDFDVHGVPLVPTCDLCHREDRATYCRLVLWGVPRREQSLAQWVAANCSLAYDKLVPQQSDDDDEQQDCTYDVPVHDWTHTPNLDTAPVLHQRVFYVGSWCAARCLRYHAAVHWSFRAQLRTLRLMEQMQRQRITGLRTSARCKAARRPLLLSPDAQLAELRQQPELDEDSADDILADYQHSLREAQRYADDDTDRVVWRTGLGDFELDV